jgi:hypothetical protein
MATATLNDMQILATDVVFGNRVLMSLTVYSGNTVLNESITAATLAQHVARKEFARGVLSSPALFKAQFVNVAASNQTVANDATAAGTLVGMTPTQVATAALACTDTDINNAVSAAYNGFVPGI